MIAKRRVREHNTGNLPTGLREAAFERATIQILTSFKVILLWEFCFLTSNTNETSGQRMPDLPKEFSLLSMARLNIANSRIRPSDLQLCTDCPDVFWSQRRLGPN